MAEWSPPTVIKAAQVLAVASAARSDAVTLSGDWEMFADRLSDTSWEESSLHNTPCWQAGVWSPAFWVSQLSIVQYYRDLLSSKAVAPISRQAMLSASRAATLEQREASAADPPRRAKYQRAFVSALTSSTFSSPFTVTLAKRISSWGLQVPQAPGELSKRWDSLASELKTVRPSWRWATFKTLSGGWTTTARMHVLAPRKCVFGCTHAPDSFPHYLSCPVLLRLLWFPSTPLIQSTLAAWGLGPAAAYAVDPTSSMSLRSAISRIALAFHIYNKMKQFAARSSVTSESDLAAARSAAIVLQFR